MEKQGTSSVFKRLFLFFLAMVVVVYGIIIVLFANYATQQQEIEESGYKNAVANSVSVLTQQLDAVYNVQSQLFNDVRVARLAHRLYEDAYERSQLILDLLSSMQNTQSINSIISDIVILFPESQIELSAVDGYHRRMFTAETFSEGRSSTDEPLVLHQGHLELNISYPLRTALEEDYIPDYEVRIVLSQEYLDSFLDRFRTSSMEGGFWAVQGEDGHLTRISARDRETLLMESWSVQWENAGSPNSYAEDLHCELGEFRMISQKIADYNLILVTYRNSLTIAWELGNEILYIVLTVVLMGLLFGFFVSRANQSINKPLRKIMDAFQKVSSGDLKIRLSHPSKDEFGYIYDSFNDTVDHIEMLIDNITEQKTLLQKAELMQLQSQINPRFLYNSFYNLKFMAQNEDYEQIATFTTALAKYYRFINKETHWGVELSSEAAHMENYIEIQQMRFGDQISVAVQPLPAELRDFRVPKLILQPIIENAYNYGLRNTLSGGLLTVEYHMEGKFLCIVIEDNGGEMTQDKLVAMRNQIHTYEGDAINHAMTNIQRRLELAYGQGCGLELDIGKANGLRVTLKMDTTVQLS